MAARANLERVFTTGLMAWHRNHNTRSMPWKGEPDPYKIWLSEIILQQTRVEQGLGYYLRFTETYPDINALAAAPDAEVFKLWEGLGYYSRCRNLLHTARTIVSDYGGKFPPSYRELLSLKGVGPYTAAAIASFGFGLPYAVLDGNVIRVLSRFFCENAAFDTPTGKKLFQEMADKVLDSKYPGAFNQAIMDFGATICKPLSPLCPQCPLKVNCLGLAKNKVQELPVRQRKAEKRERFFACLILRFEDKIWIRERTGRDIWRHLHEFFTVELQSETALLQFDPMENCRQNGWAVQRVNVYPQVLAQALTHQQIRSRFFSIDLKIQPFLPPDGKWVPVGSLTRQAFPKTITQLLSSHWLFQ